MSKTNIIIIINILLKLIFTEKLFKVPFKFYSTSSFFPNQSHPVTNKFMSEIVIPIAIGNPPQKFNASLKLNSYHTVILSEDLPGIQLNKYFNKSLSSSYICIKNNSIYFNEDFQMAETFSDNFQIFSNSTLFFQNKFYLLLVRGLAYNVPNEFYTSGTIGLRLRSFASNQEDSKKKFTYQIKENGLSENEIFTFQFEGDDGYFIIGKNAFNNSNYLSINTGVMPMKFVGLEWSFNFDFVVYGNEQLESKNTLLKNEIGLFVGPTDYENKVFEKFFKNNTKCYRNSTKMGYATFKYYYCDEDVDVNQMDNLVFGLDQINYNFTFSGKELFYEENKKKYFKIVFLLSNNPYWFFGREFLKKYQLYFDMARKLIYIPLNKEENKNNYYSIFHICLTIVLGISVIALIFYIFRYLKKYPRKKRANELEDDFDYIIQ